MTNPAPYAEVRAHANAGDFAAAADAWTRHLAALKEEAWLTWGRALDSKVPGVKDNAKNQARDAQFALTEWETKAGLNPSAAVGQLIATWPANESAAAGGAA